MLQIFTLFACRSERREKPMQFFSILKKKRITLVICELAISKSQYFFNTLDYAMQICIILQPPSTWQLSNV